MCFLGQHLDINLSDRKTTVSTLSTGLLKQFLPGLGLNMLLLNQNIGPSVDPLGAENVIIIGCGLLAGTAAPFSSRLQINFKSPLTRLLGSTNVGGNFAAKLKSCGFQSVLIRGRSNSPVYLSIVDKEIKIQDANPVWGLDTRDTQSHLENVFKDKHFESLVIGPAGENQVLFACAINGQHNAAGRTGLGAVMGSKNLKAIVVRGGLEKVARSPSTSEAVNKYVKQLKNSPIFKKYATYGSALYIGPTNEAGALCTRNYRDTKFEHADKISGEGMHAYVKKSRSCTRCPVHCKADIEIREGKYAGLKGARPDFETAMALGSKCGLKDTEALLHIFNLCNRVGIDTVSAGGAIAFAMDLYDQGILSLEDTGGLELAWGNSDAMEALINQIVRREGLGAVLSKGIKHAARTIGKGSEKFAHQVKGLELPCIDPRGYMGLALGYAVAFRGADFATICASAEIQWSPDRAERELGYREAADQFSTIGKGDLIKRCMIVSAVLDALGLCKTPVIDITEGYHLENESDLTQSLTGWSLTCEDFFRIGENILHMEKIFNLNNGASVCDDILPDKFMSEAAMQGPIKGSKVSDLKSMLKDFYSAMGWNDKGEPGEEILVALNLQQKLSPEGRW